MTATSTTHTGATPTAPPARPPTRQAGFAVTGKVGGRNRIDAIRIARDAGWL